MIAFQMTRASGLAPALLVGVGHFAAAICSLMLTRWSNGLASIWLPNAILLAYLLLNRRERWPFAVAAVIASGTAANYFGGAMGPTGLVFGATNGLEPLLIAVALRAGRQNLNLENIRDLLRFVAAIAVLPILSSTIASAAAFAYKGSFWGVWISWYCSSVLGLAIATPLLLVGWSQIRSPRLSPAQLAKGVAALLLVAAAGAVVFTQTRWPLFFLLGPPVLIATFRLRALGAGASVFILAVIGTIALNMGTGPSALVEAAFGERMALLQVFLAITVLTALPVAALLGERDRFAASLAEREKQLASVVDAVSDVIFRTDRDGRWTYLNPAWEQLTGYSVEESIGRSFLKHVVEEDRQPFLDRLKALELDLFGMVRHQFRFRTASGEYRWAEAQSSRLNGSNGEWIGAAGILVDISDRLALAALSEDLRKQAEREAEAARLIAATDDLTGVASRRAFLAYFDQLLERGDPLAVAIFDIDFFKSINDRYGHAVGDEVLKQVAAIAGRSVRDGDLVGRIGGEEFAVIMPGASIEHAARVGDRLRQSCAETVHPPGLSATISVGVSATAGGGTSAALLREADAALYRAKFEGRNCLRIAA
jgi:diguanylate cyclase (GGDEF)-like protein/PAS domain S-box-containing protein